MTIGAARRLARRSSASSSRSRCARRRRCCRFASSGSGRWPPPTHDGDRRRGRVLGVLPPDAVPAGRPPLLARSQSGVAFVAFAARWSWSRTSRRWSWDGSACERRSRPASLLGRLGGAAHATAGRRALLLGHLPGLRPRRRRHGLSFVPVTIASLAGVERADAGVASGLINTSRQIGGAIGIAADQRDRRRRHRSGRRHRPARPRLPRCAGCPSWAPRRRRNDHSGLHPPHPRSGRAAVGRAGGDRARRAA